MNHVEELLSSLSHLNLDGFITNRQPHASGYGASCDVYSAWSTRHKKTVAVKQIRYFMVKDDAFTKRLAKELRIWTALNNENVLPLLGYVVEGPLKTPSMVSEWMERGTLHDFMKSFPRSSVETCTMLFGIASGLAYLHSKGVIHADLKSQNVLISPHGSPLLADFGLSRVITQSETTGTTSSLTARGTVRWMAKELLLPAEGSSPNYSEQTDIWAFGMVIFELLSWKVPYCDIRGDLPVMMAITRGELPTKPAEGEDKAIFDGLWELCQRCWSEPQQRPSATKCMKTLAHIESHPIPNDGLSVRDAFHRQSKPIFDQPSSPRDIYSTYTYSVFSSATAPGFHVASRAVETLKDALADSSRTIGVRLGKLAGKAGAGKYAAARKTLKSSQQWRFRDWSYDKQAGLCDLLLNFALLDSRSIQTLTFQAIIHSVTGFPPLRQVFVDCSQAKKLSLEFQFYSWRNPERHYGPEWNYLYELARKCLLENPISTIMEDLDRNSEKAGHNFVSLSKLFDQDRKPSGGNGGDSVTEDLDAYLALEFFTKSWNGTGLDTYLIRQGYKSYAFARFITSVLDRFKIAELSCKHARLTNSWDESFDLLVSHLISAIWRSLVPSEVEEHEVFLQDKDDRMVWSIIHAIYCASRSAVGEKLTPKSYGDHALPWKEKCRAKLSGPRYSTLLRRLFDVEDNDQQEVQKRFAPPKAS